jgi:TonB family protein
MLAAAMLQVQPALAQQAVAAAPAPVVGAVEEQTPLLSGSHAQQQLRKAGHDLAEAERKATTDEERAKIATARAVVGAAQSQLAAASGHEGPQQIVVELGDLQGIDPQVRVQLDRLKVMKIDPKFNIQMKAMKDLKLDAKTQAEIAKAQKIDMKKMQADIDASRAEVERVMSPEFHAQIKAQVDEARKVNRAQIDRAMAEAKKQVEAAVQAQKQAQQAMEESRLVARNEAPVMPVPAEVASQAEQQPIKIDASKMAGNKIGGSNPVYPEAAKKAHISGSVLIHAIIDEKGNVEDAKVLRENAPDDSLAEAALNAVMNWKYRPYLLNGNPTAVETTITVNFSLTN